MFRKLVTASALVCALSTPSATVAGSLQVAPVTLDVVKPVASSSIRLRNEGATPLVAQVRVYRWSQINGAEKLDPTDDVAASPPMVNIQSGAEAVVRVVNLGGGSAKPEDAYRLVIDEVPNRAQQKPGSVAIVVRHSIPVFMRTAASTKPQVAFAVEARNGRQFLTATNVGSRRIRLARMVLKDEAGNAHRFGEGLNGYVLSGSSFSWVMPANSRPLTNAKTLTLSAETDIGPINETVSR
jgi:fimbrial chaperone protein